MRTSKAALGSIIGALVLRATVAAGESLPTAVAPQPPAVPPIAPEPRATVQTRWYGWPLLITDAAALSLAARLIADNSGDGKALLFSASVFLLGGPIVHAANGHATRAGYSVALRVGLSLLGWAAGLGVGGDSCRARYVYDHEGCPFVYAAYGALIGGGLAAAVDAVVLSREQVAAPPPVAPHVGVTALPGGGGLSLVGRFW